MSVNINYFKILGTKNSHFLFSRFLAVSKFQTGKSALRYLSDDVWEDGEKKVAKKTNISKAMKAYLERAQQYDEFIRKEKTEYQIGKRHLANMMGEDPEMFTQEDVDRAIEYLFPSGLYEPKARPLMKPPEEVFPPKKAAEFDSSGRPYHFLFYTGRPNFFQLMFDAVSHMNALNDFEDKMIRKHIKPDPSQALDLSGSEWTPKEDLEVKIVERLHDADYKNFLSVMDRLASHPYAHRAKDFILAYRKHLIAQTAIQDIPKPEYDAQGRAFVTIKNCLRKAARAEVTVRSPGTGKISINGKGIEYFEGVQPREQDADPLIAMLRDKRERSRSQTSGMRDKKRVVLDRAISMTERIPVRSSAVTYHTASPSLLKRWRNQRREGTIGFNLNLKGIADEDEESGDFSRIDYGQSPPSDEMIFFDSFEAMVPEELRVRICKESIRANLIEILRSSIGSIRTLEEIEQGKITAENVDGLSSKPQLEKNISFLWAAFLNKSELLPGLLKCGAELHSCDTDGLTALHLAAFSDDVGACKFLISRGAMVNFIKKRYTPLHCAAFGNSPSAAKLLLNNGAKIDYYKDGTSGDGTALHSAVKANSTECLQLLVESRADVNSIEPEGCSPLHLAADLGHVECLKILLNCEGIDVNVKTRDKQATALHLAAENGYSECVSLLLSKGADPAEKNSRGQTALHLAARAQSLECVEALLSVGGCDVNVLDNDLRTPLHSAVGKALQAYDVAELLIGWKSDVNAKDKYGYTPLHVAALNELSQCVETLLYHGADACARTKGGTTALSIMIRKTPAALGMVNQKLDSAISMHDPEASHREVELKLDFRHLLQHSSQGEISYLKTFVDEGQKEILQHPLCEAFLHLKWKKIRKFYIARLLFCFLYVLSLTMYVMSALAHRCYDQTADAFNNTSGLTDPCPNNSVIGGWFRRHPIAIEMEWYILVFFTVCEILRKVYGITAYSSVRQYIEQAENLIEWAVIVSVFAISFIYTGRIDVWQCHVGAFAVLIGWTNLMLMIGQLPLLGSYVAMYTRVQKEFAKLFVAYSCLLIGFTISFCVIFPKTAQFSNPLVGFIAVLVFMTGEVSFEGLLTYEEGKEPPFLLEVSAHVIFVIFLLFVTIILMNLLVGIAVHDIQGLQKTAGLLKLERQTRLISYIESALFNGNLSKYLFRFLQWTALVSPSAYRVVLHVKPLNPRENRLPKDVLKAAYELAKQRKRSKYTAGSRISCMTTSTFTNMFGAGSVFSDGTSLGGDVVTNIQTLSSGVEGGAKAIVRLSEEVGELKKMMMDQQMLISSLLQTLQKKDSDC